MNSEKNHFTFDQVLNEELHSIREARSESGLDVCDAVVTDAATPLQLAHAARLQGLALSGGGIRSATFNLGILQALAEVKQLRRFDYLSTVSGGGYIGSWLSALLAREANGDPVALESALSLRNPGGPVQKGMLAPQVEHRAIRFLRSYSNYLTPKTGIFSADSLAFITTYLRNLILNFLILVSFLGATLLVPILLTNLFRGVATSSDEKLSFHLVGLAAIGISLTAVFFVSANMARLRDVTRADDPWYTRQTGIIATVVLPITLAATLFSRFMWNNTQQDSDWYLIFALLYPVAWAAGWALENVFAPGQTTSVARPGSALDRIRNWIVRTRWMILVPATLASLVVGAVLFLWFRALADSWTSGPYALWHLVTWGPPIVLITFGFATTLYIGVMGDAFTERGREWWSRVGAWLVMTAGAWSVLFFIAIYSGVMLEQITQFAGPWLNKVIASGWLFATIGGVLAGHGQSSRKQELKWVVLGKVTPYIFVVGLLMLLMECLRQSAFASVGEDTLRSICSSNVTDAVERSVCLLETATRNAPVAIVFGCLLALGLVLSWRVDINLFSLHMMYRNRLTRCFLGASRDDRHPQPFIGFDPFDDMPLATVGANKPQRPYHIINTALNLVRGRQLAWQQRKAANFVFTPKFTGYLLTDPPLPAPASRVATLKAGCYRPTRDYSKRGKGISLGTVMAISGAAASPNMGAQSSPAMTFLLTMFNVRLGRWCGNPLHPRTWLWRGPAWGGKYLFLELFGLTDEITPFVYLSDGGHFENMGVYELVRRRCAVIVVCDCGADPDYQFEDLANAIQKCYTDFGIEIKICVDRLRTGGNAKGERSHVAIGEIGYDRVDPNASPGKLILVKPCMNGDEPSDVQSFQARHADFPQQPTTDQWFDETQFESYRKLGFHIGMKLADVLAAKTAIEPVGTV